MIEAKKRYGQNFLKDRSILQKIIQSMPKSERALVEIGPGLGDLTQRLLGVKPVIAYEVDRDLCKYLQNTFAKDISNGRLDLKQGDVLKQFQEHGSLAKEPFDLVANLPYYIATTIILEALKDPFCKSLTVMIQKEVALKFAASCGDKSFTSLAILANSIGVSELLFDVGSEAFDPPPKVISSVLKIVKKCEYIQSEEQTGLFNSYEEFLSFSKYLQCAFTAPRKTWLKNVSQCFDRQKASVLLEKEGFEPNIRSHQVSVSSHHRLFNELTQGEIYGKKTGGVSRPRSQNTNSEKSK